MAEVIIEEEVSPEAFKLLSEYNLHRTTGPGINNCLEGELVEGVTVRFLLGSR